MSPITNLLQAISDVGFIAVASSKMPQTVKPSAVAYRSRREQCSHFRISLARVPPFHFTLLFCKMGRSSDIFVLSIGSRRRLNRTTDASVAQPDSASGTNCEIQDLHEY
jgi:hypothetical protein